MEIHFHITGICEAPMSSSLLSVICSKPFAYLLKLWQKYYYAGYSPFFAEVYDFNQRSDIGMGFRSGAMQFAIVHEFREFCIVLSWGGGGGGKCRDLAAALKKNHSAGRGGAVA